MKQLKELSSDESYDAVYGIQKMSKLCPGGSGGGVKNGIVRPKLEAFHSLGILPVDSMTVR